MADLDALLAALPAVAARGAGRGAAASKDSGHGLVDADPRRDRRERAALGRGVGRVARRLRAAGPGSGLPRWTTSLTVTDGDDAFRVRGFIDRVDRAPDGGLRIIDYKTGGPVAFTVKAVVEGKKLQLPLYALAAEQALDSAPSLTASTGTSQHAEASKFTLAGFEGGPAAAIETALAHAWEAVRGARAGQFVPHPPDGGCPDYCPAVAFCWHYRPRAGEVKR